MEYITQLRTTLIKWSCMAKLSLVKGTRVFWHRRAWSVRARCFFFSMFARARSVDVQRGDVASVHHKGDVPL